MDNRYKIKDIIEIVCRLLEIVVVCIIGVIVWFAGLNISSRANEILEKQNELSKINMLPYFSIEDISSNGNTIYKINNEGGYIQNATIYFSQILSFTHSAYKNRKVVYIRYNDIEANLYDIKDESFTIEIPDYKFYINDYNSNLDIIENLDIKEFSNEIHKYYADEKFYINIGNFDIININYIDGSRIYREDKYLIGNKDNKPFLAPLGKELENNIISNMPEDIPDYLMNAPYLYNEFPSGTIREYNRRSPGSSVIYSDLEKFIYIIDTYLKN